MKRERTLLLVMAVLVAARAVAQPWFSKEDIESAVEDEVAFVRRPEREMLPAILNRFGLTKTPRCKASDQRCFDRQRVASILDAQLARKKREQSGWPSRTDCDRFDDAIVTLQNRGIVVLVIDGDRHYGFVNAEAELKRRLNAGTKLRALAFFHPGEDVWKAVHGGTLPMLAIVPETTSQAKYNETVGAVRNEIVAAFREHGLNAYLTGLGNLTIAVDVKWQRRLDRPLAVVHGDKQ